MRKKNLGFYESVAFSVSTCEWNILGLSLWEKKTLVLICDLCEAMLVVQGPDEGNPEGLTRSRGLRTEDKSEVNNNTETESENRSEVVTEI